MNGVAIGAHDVILRVRTAADIGARERLGMAAQARVQHFPWAQLGKGANGFLPAAGVEVISTGAVATLATRVFGLLLAGGDALEVRIAVERRRNIIVAATAQVAADIVVS